MIWSSGETSMPLVTRVGVAMFTQGWWLTGGPTSSVEFMTETGVADGSERWKEIDRSLDGTVAGSEHGAARLDMAMRDTLGELRVRLQRVHVRPHDIGQREWAAYMTDLDRGLAELPSELARVAERPEEGPSVADVLYARRTQFEVEGWTLRLAAIRDRMNEATSSIEQVSDLVSACDSELFRFREACSTRRDASRDRVDDAVERLRSAVERVDDGRAEA